MLDNKSGYRIASIGVQWTYSYLMDLWHNVTRDDPGWKDCLKSGKKCLLVSNEGFVLGSVNGPAGRHMSEIEPKFLEALMKASLIKKEVYRDYQADCPMEKRGHQLLSGASSPRPASIQKIFQKFVSYLYSIAAIDLMYFVEKTFSRPIIINGSCRYETPENMEQCTLEFYRYTVVNKKNEKLLVHLSSNSDCKG